MCSLWFLLLLKCHNVWREWKRAALSRCSQAWLDSLEFISPVFCVGCTQHEREWEIKASWVGDGCLMMTQRHLSSPRSSREQRRLCRGQVSLCCSLSALGQVHVISSTPTIAAVLSPLLFFPLPSFPFLLCLLSLCLSFMLSLIFTDNNPSFFLRPLKRANYLCFPAMFCMNLIQVDTLSGSYLNPQSWYPHTWCMFYA